MHDLTELVTFPEAASRCQRRSQLVSISVRMWLREHTGGESYAIFPAWNECGSVSRRSTEKVHTVYSHPFMIRPLIFGQAISPIHLKMVELPLCLFSSALSISPYRITLSQRYGFILRVSIALKKAK